MSSQDPSTSLPAPATTLVVDALPDPNAPVPSGAAPPALVPRPPRGPLTLLMDGLAMALGRPRVLLFLLGFSILSALPAALPVYRSAVEHLGMLPPTWHGLPLDFHAPIPAWIFLDWQRADPGLQAALSSGLAAGILFASLSGLLICAGWMSLAVGNRREHGLYAFLRGAGRHFFPFFRTWLIGLALFYALTWLVWGPPGEALVHRLLPGGDPSRASSENLGRWVVQGREILSLFALLIGEVLLDLARASLVAGGRRSALLAMLRGLLRLLMEPLRILSIVGAGLVLDLLWVAALAALVSFTVVPLWALVFLVPLGRILFRGARYGAFAMLFQDRIQLREAETAHPSLGV